MKVNLHIVVYAYIKCSNNLLILLFYVECLVLLNVLQLGSSLQNCVASLKVLVTANDVTTCKSLCRLAWKPRNGKALAVPVETEVKIYKRLTWKPKCSLKDDYHQKVIYFIYLYISFSFACLHICIYPYSMHSKVKYIHIYTYVNGDFY